MKGTNMSKQYAHKKFGNYVSHAITTENTNTKFAGKPNTEYKNFPFTRTLTVFCENGELQYRNYNCPEDLCNRIVQMSPKELFADSQIENMDELLVEGSRFTLEKV